MTPLVIQALHPVHTFPLGGNITIAVRACFGTLANAAVFPSWQKNVLALSFARPPAASVPVMVISAGARLVTASSVIRRFSPNSPTSIQSFVLMLVDKPTTAPRKSAGQVFKILPPLSNRGVTFFSSLKSKGFDLENSHEKYVTYTLDWLTVSFDWRANYRLYMPADCFAVSDAKLAPLPAYNRAAKLNVGRLDWHTEKPEQKRLLTFSGRDIANLAAFGVTQSELLSMVLSLPLPSITRLDFATDIHYGEVTASDVKTLLERGYVSTSARKSSDIEERVIGSEGSGMTVYIGSRASTLMLRVYDKGKKERSGYNWLRIELEAKKERAMILAREILKHELHTAGCAAIRQFASIDSPEISDALTGAIEIDLSVGRRLTDWEKWVVEVALPNVQKAFEQELPGVVEWVSGAAWSKLAEKVLMDIDT